MTSSTIPADVQARRQAQNTFRIGLATAGVMALVSAAFYLMTPNRLVLLVPAPLVMVGLVVAALARFGRARLGAWLLIGVILALTVIGPLTSTGQGFLYAVVSLVMMAGVAAATLPDRWAGRLVLPSIAAAMLAVLADLFGPPGRPAPANPLVGYTIAGGVLLAYLVIVARQFPNYPIRTKFILVFAVISLASSGAIAALASRIITEQLTAAAGRSLVSVAELQARAVGDLLVRQVDILRGGLSLNTFVQEAVTFANLAHQGKDPAQVRAVQEELDRQWQAAAASDPLIQSRLSGELADELREFQSHFPDHIQLSITDQAGGLLASTDRAFDYDQADEVWWQAAWGDGAGSVYVSQPEFEVNRNSYVVVIAVPLYGPDSSRPIGVLRSAYRLGAINEVAASQKLGLVAGMDLLFPNGTRLSETGRLEGVDFALLARLRQSSRAEYTGLNYEGQDSFAAQALVAPTEAEASVAALNWRVVAHEHAETVLAPAAQQTRVLALVTLAVALLAAALAVGAAQVLVAPILRLTAAAQKLAAGSLSVRVPVTSEDELGTLGRVFNQVTAQLAEMVGALEHRVAERTRALNTSAEVSRRLSSVLDPQQLVVEVVEQLREAFNYYHAHIYLLDEASQSLVMAGGTGEAGRVMLARGHKIAAGRGLVGRAAATGQPVLVPDTAQDPGWLPNPLLPDTRAEVAVPILAGGQVVGVLDVQQNVAGGLTQADADLLQSIASQVGVALQNARAYEQTRRQASRDALIAAIGQRLQSAATVEQVLKITAQELAQALTARRASVLIAADGAPSAGPRN